MPQKKIYLNIRSAVFWPSVVLFYSFITMFFLDQDFVLQFLKKIQDSVLPVFSNIYQFGVFFIFLFSFYLYMGPLGNKKIGGKNAKPILKKSEWFYITLCTVTAAAVLFWACCEPLYHIHNSSLDLSKQFSTADPEAVVLSIMYLHWTFIPYCIYLVPSVFLALTILEPKSPISFGGSLNFFFNQFFSKKAVSAVDSLCLLTLMTGMSSSLAVGVYMISSALEHLFSVKETPVLFAAICFVIVFSFVLSAASGLMRGIRVLSNINTKLFYLLSFFVVVMGPTKYIFFEGLFSFRLYVQNFFNLTVFSHQFFPNTWFKDWTALHWGSWLSWAPMTGLFLARLAYGYTVKEMIQVQVILPGIFTCFWLAIFSGSALYFDKTNSNELFNALGQRGPQSVLFELFSYFPGVTVLQFVLLFIVFISFVTAADSNIEAISSLCLSSNSSISSKSSWFIKVFLGASIGIVSWIMVVYTGIDGMRIINYLGGIPSLFLLFIFVAGLVRFSFLKEDSSSES